MIFHQDIILKNCTTNARKCQFSRGFSAFIHIRSHVKRLLCGNYTKQGGVLT